MANEVKSLLLDACRASLQDCSSCVDSWISRERTDPNNDLLAISASHSHIKLIDLNSTTAYYFRKTSGFAIKSLSDREYIMSSSRLF